MKLNFTKISAGGFHTCGLLPSGGVKCWGSNEYGQIGDDTIMNRDTPVDVSGLTSGVTAIAAGGSHTCALLSGGSVKCWGLNYSGQLGDGTNNDRHTPVAVNGLASGVTAITAGGSHTCALLSGGEMKCWGGNWDGQLGDGTIENRNMPVNVSGLTSGVTAIAGGEYHTCAVLSGGGVKCWGSNYFGQLGDGTQGTRWTPVDVSGLTSGVTAIATGVPHTCALLLTGGIKCWGGNGNGQLGDGTSTDSPEPVDVIGLDGSVAAIATGNGHTCALLTTGGVMCWGWNDFGQLGDGTRADHRMPAYVSELTSGGTAIVASQAHSCALLSNGRAKCWGGNLYGQLGTNIMKYRTIPVDVIGLVREMTTIADGGSHTCALLPGGGVKCWGMNGPGQLGDGTADDHGTPMDVSGLSSGVTTIGAGANHTCAALSGGGMKCWGNNYHGQLGDGSTTTRRIPVDVSWLTDNVTAIAAGNEHTCALLASGGVKCWGMGAFGQLGNGSTDNHPTPVEPGFYVTGSVKEGHFLKSPTFDVKMGCLGQYFIKF